MAARGLAAVDAPAIAPEPIAEFSSGEAGSRLRELAAAIESRHTAASVDGEAELGDHRSTADDGARGETATPALSLATPPTAPPSAASRRARRDFWRDQPKAERLPWKAYLQRELGKVNQRERCDRAAKAKAEKHGEGAWTAGRIEFLEKQRAITRARVIEGSVADARRVWSELANHKATHVYAIGIKKLCNRRGWTLADMAARRRLALVYFGLLVSVPTCFNGRWAMQPRFRRGERRSGLEYLRNTFGGMRQRKYAPCMRAVAQSFLAEVLADPGHTAADRQDIHRDTVRECTLDLQDVNVLDAYQPPRRAVGAWEASGAWAFKQYWFHSYNGSAKPKLLGAYDADGRLLDLELLTSPWSAARLFPRRHTDPPPDDPPEA